MKTNKRVCSLLLAAFLCVGLLCLGGCKSAEQIAAGVQSTAAIRDVVYNEAPEVVHSTVTVRGSGNAVVALADQADSKRTHLVTYHR